MPGDCYTAWNMGSWKMSPMEIFSLLLNLKSIKINGFIRRFVMNSEKEMRENQYSRRFQLFQFSQKQQSWIVKSYFNAILLNEIHEKKKLKSFEWRLRKYLFWLSVIFLPAEIFMSSGGNISFRFCANSRFFYYEFRVQFMCLLHFLMGFYDVCNLSQKNKFPL